MIIYGWPVAAATSVDQDSSLAQRDMVGHAGHTRVMTVVPTISYADVGGAMVAYQTFGTGPPLVLVAGPASHLDWLWEEPSTALALTRLAEFSQLIMFDRRGTGLSDPIPTPSLDQQVADLVGVLDTIGVERTALWGASDSGLCATFAARYPDRAERLMLWGATPRMRRMLRPDMRDEILDAITRGWAEGSMLGYFAPSRLDDPAFRQWWTRFQRNCCSPSFARELLRVTADVDLSDTFRGIRCPTLVVHRANDLLVPQDAGEEVSRLIPGAEFVSVPGKDNYGFDPDLGTIGLVETFMTGTTRPSAFERTLKTILFIDICDSTSAVAARGDAAWRGTVVDHEHALAREVAIQRGEVVKTTGDGMIAVFDSPGRAIRAASHVVTTSNARGLPVRAGLHIGECQLIDDDIRGLAVHIAARVCDLARHDEILVTSTVHDLVLGSEHAFEAVGEHQLRGVPRAWQIYRLADTSAA
jgi:class 3 adenylate cyclase/pimeloyl-ACP methyl ester carboxylesterase